MREVSVLKLIVRAHWSILFSLTFWTGAAAPNSKRTPFQNQKEDRLSRIKEQKAVYYVWCFPFLERVSGVFWCSVRHLASIR